MKPGTHGNHDGRSAAELDAGLRRSSLLASIAAHVPALVWFAAVAFGLTAPLWAAPDRTIVGAGFGDNAVALWNFWWAQAAVSHQGQSLLFTDAIFAPLGTSLLLHSGTLLPSTLSALLFRRVDPVTAYNTWIAMALFLNGACAYAAAYHYTGRRDAAVLGGTIFAAAPFLVVRMLGHLNLLCAWGLPLVAIAADKLIRRPTASRAAATGLAVAALAYVDYYYFIFAALLVVLQMASSRWRLDVRRSPLTPARRRIVGVVLALALALVVIAVVIASTGGTELLVLGRRVRLYGTFNLRLGTWVLCVSAAVAWLGPRLSVSRTPEATGGGGACRSLGIVTLCAAVLISPLLLEAWRIWTAGDYVSQHYFWRSGPPGIDIVSLVIGNPTSFLYGSIVRGVYAVGNIDPVESVTWLGVVPIGLLIFAVRRLRGRADMRCWLAVLVVFVVWSLGPSLTVFGANTGFALPEALVRFVPVLDNARLPGRAFTMVVLAVAMIASLAAASLARGEGAWRGLAYVLIGLTLVDYWPSPYQTTPLDQPSVYRTLAALPHGVLLDLPLGIRDGFGERGHLDHGALYYQTLHEQPMVGGFVSRLSARVRRRYETDAVLGPMLALSGGAETPGSRGLGSPADTLACSIRYVMMPRTLRREVEAFTRSVFTLRLEAETATRSLYSVTGVHAPYCVRRRP